MQRSFHLTLCGILGFLLYSASGKRSRMVSSLLSVVAAISLGYIMLNYNRIALRQSLVSYLSPVDLILGAVVMLVILELTRRTIGWMLSVVGVVGLLYAYFGRYMPDLIAHPGISLRDMIDYQVYGLDGIYSMPLGISATYIVLFIILGTIMEYTHSSDVIMDIGKIIAGRFRGGPAKIACLTSALVGSISGSAAANVYATGTFTIPMMKKIGYKPAVAGAVEAIASTGGQIMPPVMGAAAFIMAEILGVPYIDICKAALVPAVFYYLNIFFLLDFLAAKNKIRGLPREEIPSFKKVLPGVYLLFPLVLLIVMLVKGYTPFRASFFAIVLSFGLSFIRKETRFTLSRLVEAVVTAARRTVMIAIACGIAGMIIGVITQTGLGLTLSSIILSLSGGKLWLALVFIMISCIIMGMGTPTTVAYIIVSTIAAPIMKGLGFSSLPSHLFIFYFAVLSMITPPVAIAAYAAGEIAREDPIRVGFYATRLAAVVYSLPFIFLFDHRVLLMGNTLGIVFRLMALFVAFVLFAAAVAGWLFKSLSIVERIPLVGLFLALVVPILKLNVAALLVSLSVGMLFLYLARKKGVDGSEKG